MAAARLRRVPVRVWVIVAVLAAALVALVGPVRSIGAKPAATEVVLKALSDDDAGDKPATTTFDGPLVRRRPAIGIHPLKDADRKVIVSQLRAAAAKEKLGPLEDANFAVFSEELLNYMVPEVVMVLPEGRTVEDAEVIMKDHDYPTVGYYLVESVLVHDLTFAVIPNGVSAAQVKATVDREGILTDSLGRYATTIQSTGLTVRYLGNLLSDSQIRAVRQSLADAAHVTADQVLVEPSSPGAGVDLANDPGDQLSAGAHKHG